MMVRALCLLVLLGIASPAGAAEPRDLNSAISLYNAQRVPEARPIFKALVASQPGNIQARLYLARCMNVMHDRDASIELLADTVKLAPKNDLVLAEYGAACLHRADELGVSFRALSLARRGRNALEDAVALRPDNVIYREGLVDFYRQAPGIAGGSLKRAHEQAEIVSKLDPLRGKLLLASLAAQENEIEHALTICREIIVQHPDNYLALYTFGRAATEAGVNLEEASDYLRRCLELTPSPSEPNHAGAYYRLGVAAEKSGRTEEARTQYRRALELQPVFPKASDALDALK